MDIQPIRETDGYQAIWLAYANLYLSTNKNLVRVTNASELQVLALAVDDPEIWVVVADGRDYSIEPYSLREDSVYYEHSLNSLLAAKTVIYAMSYQQMSEHFEVMVSAPVTYAELYTRLSREYLATEKDVTTQADNACIKKLSV